MDDIVNIPPSPEEDGGPISPFFAPGTEPTANETTNQIPPDTAQPRAEQYNYALGQKSPGLDSIYQSLTTGQEDRMRSTVATQQSLDSINGAQKTAQTFLDTNQDRPLNMDDVKFLHELSTSWQFPDQIDPKTVMESNFSDQILREATTYNNDDGGDPPIFTSALDSMKSKRYMEYSADQTTTDTDAKNMAITQQFLTTNFSVRKVAEDFLDQHKDTEGIASNVYNVGKTLINPAATWWYNHDAIEKSDTLFDGLAGNIKEQIDNLYSGKYTPAEAQELTKTALENMYARNPVVAKDLANKILSYSDSDALVDKVAGGLDLVLGAQIGHDLYTAMKAASRVTTIAGIKDLTGQNADAALRDVITQAKQVPTGTAKNSLTDLMGVVPAITAPDVIAHPMGPMRFSIGEANNIGDMLKNYGTGIIKALSLDPANVTRLPPGSEAYKVALDEAQQTVQRVYPRTNQSILSIEPVRSIDNTIGNNDIVRFNIGGPGAEPFVTTYQAKQAVRRYGLDKSAYKIVSHGQDDFAIQIEIPIDETLPSVKFALRKHMEAVPTPDTIQSRFMNYFRASDKFRANDVNMDTKIAAGGVQKLVTLNRDVVSREVGALRKESREALSDFMTHQQDNEYWSGDLAKFESDWKNFHGRLPSLQEGRAYWQLRAVNDGEFLANNFRATTMKAREGIMQHKFSLKGTNPSDMPWVEGRPLKEIPWDLGDDAGILTWPNNAGQTFAYNRKVFTFQRSSASASRVGIDDLIKNQGYRVINVSKYGQEALREWAKTNAVKDFPEGRLDYIVVKGLTTKPLDFQQIPYKMGGHFFYRDPFYVGQAKVVNKKYPGGEVSNDYLGDTAWFSGRTQAEASEMAKHAEVGRQLLASGNRVGARAYIAQHMPMSYKDFARAFNPKTGFLDLKSPIHWYPGNKSIEDQHEISRGFSNFNDVNKSVHNPLNDDIKFRYGQEKGARLSGIYNIGSQEQPLWAMKPSRLVDPFNAVRRASNTIMSSRFLDDLKIKSAERYVQEFGSVIKGTYDEKSRFPLRTLMDPASIDKTHYNQQLVAKAQNYRRATMEFLGEQPQDTQRANWLMEKLVGNIKGFDRQEMAASALEKLSSVNPRSFLRYWGGFIPNMGMFNPKQLFMQAQGMTVTASVLGWDKTIRSGGVSWLMRGALINGDKDVIRGLAREAYDKWGMRPRDFADSLEALQNTDFWKVGDNWADIVDLVGNTSWTTSRRVANQSLYFFNKGERANKIVAWNASFMNWREANPLRKFDGQAVKEVYDYADFMTMNMSRASAAANQKGWGSIPTQFWSYTTRMMDMVWGDKLTAGQKGKFLMYQSLLYGVPLGTLGTSLGVLGQPSNALHKFAEYEGWDLSNPVIQAVVDGIPQTIINMATGANQNLAQTFGPNGLSVLPDIIGSSDKVPDVVKEVFGAQGVDGKDHFLDILLGAVGTSVGRIVNASEPLVGVLLNMLHPEDSTNKPYTMSDFAALPQMTTVGNNVTRSWYAWNLGNYFDRQGRPILPDNSLNGADAAMELFFGSIPQDVSNYYGNVENDKARQQAQSTARTQAVAAYRRSQADGLSDQDIQRELDAAHQWEILAGTTVVQRVQDMRSGLAPHMSKVEELNRRINTGTHENYMLWLDKANGDNE